LFSPPPPDVHSRIPPGNGDDDVSIHIVALICVTTDHEQGALLVASTTITASGADHCDRRCGCRLKETKDNTSGDVSANLIGRLPKKNIIGFIMAS
jgi:hypothetical protein